MKPVLNTLLLGLLLLGILPVATAGAATTPRFAAPETIAQTGTQSDSVAVGDIDRNGRADIVYADALAGEVRLLLNQPDGWSTRVVYDGDFGERSSPHAVAIAELDGDAELEMVVTDAGPNVDRVVIAEANGVSRTIAPSGSIGKPYGVDVADVDRDGLTDVVVTAGRASGAGGASGGTYALRQRAGDAAWAAEWVGNTSGGPVVAGALSGRTLTGFDFTGFAFTVSSPSFRRANGLWMSQGGCLGDGISHFERVFDGLIGVVYGPEDVLRFAQVEPDLIGCLRLEFELPTGDDPADLAHGDFNGDGRQDLATANRGDGTVSLFTRGAGGEEDYTRSTLAVTGEPTKIASGDFDGDGQLDLVIVDQATQQLRLVRNTTDHVAPRTTDDVPTTYTSRPVPVTLTATDGGGAHPATGVTATRFRVVAADGTTGPERSYSSDDKPVLADGERLRYWSEDAAGNVETARESAPAQVDETAPATRADGPTEPHAGELEVTLAATDTGGSGVAQIRYRFVDRDGVESSEDIYSDAARPVLRDGFRLRYHAVDAAGNAERPHETAVLVVDRDVPSSGDDVPTGWARPTLRVTLTGADTGAAGLRELRYRVVSASDEYGPERVYDADDRPVLAAGERLSYFAVDRAGNAEEAHDSPVARVDGDAPTSSDDVPVAFVDAPVRVTLSASDGAEGAGAGVESISFRVVAADGSLGEEGVYDEDHLPVLRDGERLRYRAVDEAGNGETAHDSPVARVDEAAPTTADDVPTGFRSAPVPVTLTASDGARGSGVREVRFRIVSAAGGEDGPERVYDGDDRPVLADGERLRYAAVDRVGHVETERESARAKVDAAAPVSRHELAGGWSREAVPVTLSATDTGGSDVDTIRFRVLPRQGEPGPEHTYDAGDRPVLRDGERLRYFATDGAGNAEAAHDTRTAQVDGTAPSSDDDVPAGFVATPVPVTLTATDGAGAGVDRIRYRVVSAGGEAGASRVYAADDRPVLRDGERLRYAAVDGVGNAEPERDSRTAQVDEAAPTTTDDVPVGFRSALVAVTLAASDGARGSGVREVRFRIVSAAGEAGPERSYDGGDRPVLADGERLRYRAIDRVGHVEAERESAPAKVDAAAPVSRHELTPGWSRQAVPVTLSATDAGGSGVDAIRFRVLSRQGEPGAERTYDSGDRPVLGDGERLRYFAADGAGNAEAAHETPAGRVDGAAPTSGDDVPAGFVGAPVRVTLTATDGAGSGVDRIGYRVVSAAGEVGASRVYAADDRPVLRDGERLRYAAVDHLGNAEPERDSRVAKVDEVAPVTTDDVPASHRSAPVAVTLTASDAGAREGMVTRYAIVAADGTSGPERTYDPADRPRLRDGERITYTSRDGVGNQGARRTSRAALVDEAAPTTTDDVPAAPAQTPVTVTLTATDSGGSGELVTTYAVVGADGVAGPDRTYSPRERPRLSDGERLRYATRDGAGNVEAPRTSRTARVAAADPADPASPVPARTTPAGPSSTSDGDRADTPAAPAEDVRARIFLPARGLVRLVDGRSSLGCAWLARTSATCAVRLTDARGTVLARGSSHGFDLRVVATRSGRRVLRTTRTSVDATLTVTVTTAGGATTTSRRTVRLVTDTLSYAVAPDALDLPAPVRRRIAAALPAFKKASRVTCTAPTLRLARGACAAVERGVPGVKPTVRAGGARLELRFGGERS